MMRRPTFLWALLFVAALPASLRGDAKYYRYQDDRQICYTRENRIYRYQDDRQLYYIRENRVYRYQDDRQLYYFRDNRIYRYQDDRQLYYIRENRIYRYQDDRQILYYRGDDPKLAVFMILMLADMQTRSDAPAAIR